jgi:NAD(P)-dependent dehydrogenase (short-subunit alcohol dehydrogenase family)
VRPTLAIFHDDLHPSGYDTSALTGSYTTLVDATCSSDGDGATMASWSLADMPDLSGTRAVVTGVTSGIGTPTAASLAKAGADVILVARSESKLAATRTSLEAAIPGAQFTEIIADLADASSIRKAAETLAKHGPLNLLINNAGVLSSTYRTSVDGYELHMGTNHFGPFLLTGLLMNQLVASGQGRVVTVASLGHRLAREAPLAEPLRRPKQYSMVRAYGASKLANLLFAFELDRRLQERGLPIQSLAAHPGYSATELIDKRGRRTGRVFSPLARCLAQSPELGALPTLMAATANVPGGTYIGPGGLGQVRGLPQIVKASRLAQDPLAARSLWQLSEAAVEMRYP